MNVHQCEHCNEVLGTSEYFEHDLKCNTHPGHAICPVCGYCQDCNTFIRIGGK